MTCLTCACHRKDWPDTLFHPAVFHYPVLPPDLGGAEDRVAAGLMHDFEVLADKAIAVLDSAVTEPGSTGYCRLRQTGSLCM
jgi:hypothetical protein